eukprot:COSAG06_NODE_27074_length_602_cov_0.574553_2_plen_27_part_01
MIRLQTAGVLCLSWLVDIVKEESNEEM